MNDQFREPREPDAHIAPVPRVTIQAFCERQDTASAFAAAASDRRMLKAHTKVHMGGAAAAVEAFRDAPTPNVIYIEASAGRAELIDQLEALAEICDEGTKVAIIGKQNDILLYRELMSRGVSDYIVAPVSSIMCVRSISSLFTKGDAKSIGRVVAVTGVKGGVGASTIAHNLAFLISRDYDTPTVLADLDLAFGTAALNFNQEPSNGLADAISSNVLDAALVDRLLTRCSEKLNLLAAPATVDRIHTANDEFFDGLIEILRATTPMIVLDVPAVWTSWTRRMLVTADEIVLVATPELACLRNAKNLYDILRAARPNDAPPRIVLNMVGVPKRTEINLADFTRAIETEPVSSIPFDPKVFGTAANNGQMLAEIADAGKINEMLFDLARVLTGRMDVRPVKKPSLLAPLTSLLARPKKAS